MIATLLSTLLNQSDRYILGYLTNSAEVGVYGLGYNICGLMIILIISPFSLAFSVVFWKKLRDENAKRFFTKSVTYLFFAVVYLSIFVSLFTPNLIKIFTLRTDYWAAKDIVPWIAASMPFYGITTISIFSYYATKNTKPILYFYLISLCANIILNFVLIKQYAMYGAAVSNFVSFSLLSLLFYSFSKREYFFEYEWLKIFSMFMVAIIIIYPFFYFHIDSISLQIALKVLALVIFPLLLYPLKFYEPVETQRIRELFNKYIVRRHR
jgi:O-antigen/teichoic acid export membrane protein